MNDDRIFNPRGLRHYRKTYSTQEVKWGAFVLVGLVAVGGWVAYRGAHPDPNLFKNSADLLDPGSQSDDQAEQRGALPDGLAKEGWREGKASSFDADNVYKKINGRADYFLARGFRQLVFLPLLFDERPEWSIDVEFYDLGTAENATSAYVGEKSEATSATQEDGGLWHIERNALFLAKGTFYVRLIGSVEDPRIEEQLLFAKERLLNELTAGERPWAHALLVDRLAVNPGDIEYLEENAFSFEFATRVYVASLPRNGASAAPSASPSSEPTAARTAGDVAADSPQDSVADAPPQVFIRLCTNEQASIRLARRFQEGFASMGEEETLQDATWIRDRYLGDYSLATSAGRLVYGVRGASGKNRANDALARLKDAVESLPPGTLPALEENTNTGNELDSETAGTSRTAPTDAPLAEPVYEGIGP